MSAGDISDKSVEELYDSTSNGAVRCLGRRRRKPHDEQFRPGFPARRSYHNLLLQAQWHQLEDLRILAILDCQQFAAAMGKPRRVRKDGLLFGLAAACQFNCPTCSHFGGLLWPSQKRV